MKTTGSVEVAALAADMAGTPPLATITDLPAYQIVRQPRQSIELILGPAINDNDILALDITGVFEALAKSTQTVR